MVLPQAASLSGRRPEIDERDQENLISPEKKSEPMNNLAKKWAAISRSLFRCGNKHRSTVAAHMCSINPAGADGNMHCCAATKFIGSSIL